MRQTIASITHLLFYICSAISAVQFVEQKLQGYNSFCRSSPLSEVQDWLKTVPTVNLEPVKCGNISLDEPVVEAIEEAVRQTKVNHSITWMLAVCFLIWCALPKIL